MYTYIHFNSQIKSGISKFQDLMNAPRKNEMWTKRKEEPPIANLAQALKPAPLLPVHFSVPV